MKDCTNRLPRLRVAGDLPSLRACRFRPNRSESLMIPEFKVVMFATSEIAEYSTITAEINRRYCDVHGYGFSFEQYDDLKLESPYEKVRILQRHLWSAKYLLWLDSDACVVNFSQSLLEFCDNDNDFVIAGHEFGFDLQGRHQRYEINGVPCGVNGGVMMFRSSAWTENFLKRWWEICLDASERDIPFFEQGPLQQMLIDNVLDIQSHTNVVVPSGRFNRGDGTCDNVCEFVLHLWGVGAEDRRRVFAEIAEGRLPALDVTIPRFDVR